MRVRRFRGFWDCGVSLVTESSRRPIGIGLGGMFSVTARCLMRPAVFDSSSKLSIIVITRLVIVHMFIVQLLE